MMQRFKLFSFVFLIFALSSSFVWAVDDCGDADGATWCIESTDDEFDGSKDCGGACTSDYDITIESRSNDLFIENVNGTSGHNIIIHNPTDSKITITEASTNGIFVQDSTYFELRGDSYGSETYGIKVQNNTTRGVFINRCNYYRIAYIEMEDRGLHEASADGGWTQSNDPIEAEYDHLWVHDQDGEAVYLGKSASGDYVQYSILKVHDSTIETVQCDGVQISQLENGGTFQVYDNILKNIGTFPDVCASSWGDAINLNYEIADAYVYNNYIENPHRYGIYNSTVMETAGYFYNNIIVDAGDDSIKLRTPNGSVIAHNTIVSSGDTCLDVTNGVTGTVKYNICVDASSTPWETTTSSMTFSDNRCEAAGSCDFTITGGVAGEYFTNTSGDDYSLTYQSPAINQGVGAIYTATDYNGNTRPYGSTSADIGAYEYTYKIVDALPVDDSTEINIAVDLSWHNPDTSPTVDVYFEKISGACDLQVGDLVVDDGADTESYDPGTLDESSEYCWRVDLDGETGDEYSFTTTNAIPPTSNLPTIDSSEGCSNCAQIETGESCTNCSAISVGE